MSTLLRIQREEMAIEAADEVNQDQGLKMQIVMAEDGVEVEAQVFVSLIDVPLINVNKIKNHPLQLL